MQNPPEMKKLLAIFQLKTARKTIFFFLPLLQGGPSFADATWV